MTKSRRLCVLLRESAPHMRTTDKGRALAFVHGKLRVIDDIEKLLKRVSQLQDGRDALKNLVLHDDGNGAVIVRAFQNKDRETFDILA